MAETNARTAAEMERMLTEYEQGSLTKRQYCEQQGVPLSTFDYHWQRRRKKEQIAASGQLVKVEVEGDRPGAAGRNANGFTLVLSKGRRIEVDWSYSEQDLARLIRILEAV